LTLDQAASYVSIQFDLERTSARYTGQDIATIIAAYMGTTSRIVALFHGCHTSNSRIVPFSQAPMAPMAANLTRDEKQLH
jgi:hypothetical protein